MVLEDIIQLFREIMSINKYLSAVLIFLIFFIASKLIVYIIQKFFLKLALKTKTEVDVKIIEAIQHPISIGLILVGTNLFFLELMSDYAFETYIKQTINSVLIIIFVTTLLKVIDIIIEEWSNNWSKKTKAKIDNQIIKLLHQISTLLGYIFGVLWVLSVWGVKVGPLLAGLGIGGIAIAFALQPTLANIFGGISLILDKSIKVGDVVKLSSGDSGSVYDIGIRSTRIKTWTNEILIIPNSVLVSSTLTNFNQPNRVVRADIPFGVAYGSNIQKVKKLALDCVKGEEHVLPDPAPSVMFLEMADSSLNFQLRFFVDDLSDKWPTHQRVIEKLYNTLNKNKVNIPFPQRELWVHNVKKNKK
jgi:small-conductance mechanosensitive channel